MMFNGAAMVAIALVFLSAYIFLDRITRGPCWALKEISNNPEKNERLRAGLNEFINDGANRGQFHGLPFKKGYVMIGEYSFDNPFLWLNVLEDYPEFDVDRKGDKVNLVLRTKSGIVGGLKPPYRFSEVGVYTGRSLIMFKNENEVPYLSGRGSDRLSQESYVICNVSFERGSPFN
jgi:hypothetical protein